MEKTILSFSSYPGAIYSGDDFYQTSNKLTIVQTKITPINIFLFKQALDINNYVPDFMRIMTANLIAKTPVFII